MYSTTHVNTDINRKNYFVYICLWPLFPPFMGHCSTHGASIPTLRRMASILRDLLELERCRRVARSRRDLRLRVNLKDQFMSVLMSVWHYTQYTSAPRRCSGARDYVVARHQTC